MNWDNLFEIAQRSGEESKKRKEQCEKNGGHYKDKAILINSKLPGYKCRCGMYLLKEHCKNWKTA